MKKNTKLIVWSVVGLSVATSVFFGIRALVKKSKARNVVSDSPTISDDIKKNTVIKVGLYATKDDALDLIDKAKKKDEQRQASAPIGLTVGKNWITKVDSNPNWLQEYLETFIDSKVLKAEYNAVLQFITEFDKEETTTLKKLNAVESELLKSFDKKFTKLKKKINYTFKKPLTQDQANAIANRIQKIDKMLKSYRFSKPSDKTKIEKEISSLEQTLFEGGYTYSNGKAVKNVG